MAKSAESKTVVVTGDVTTDWNLVTIEQDGVEAMASPGDASAVWSSEGATGVTSQPGGTALLGELIREVASPLGFRVHHVGEMVGKMDPRFRHSYAVWSRFPYERGEDNEVWRVDRFLGLDRRDQQEGLEAVAEWNRSIADLTPDLVILDDADLGFRDDKRLWPEVLLDDRTEGRPWVILKMAPPVARGNLFDHLVSTCPERVVVVTRINDLRQSEVRISRELSWELTAEDLLWELTYNAGVSALAECAHVVVSIETGGALVLSTPPGVTGGRRAPKATLFYDPRFIEGEWARRHPGKMIGSTSCLTAGVAHSLLGGPDRPNVSSGVRRGLAAMRALHLDGWGPVSGTTDDLGFPSTEIAKVLSGRKRTPYATFARTTVPPALADQAPGDGGEERRWTILEEDRGRGRLDEVAPEIAIKGVEAVLKGVPIGQFGGLTTVDRQEIEGLRAISALIQEYRSQSGTSPLSIAVFGPPGSGKSFGVKQVAKSLLHDAVAELSFNLSQLNDPGELYGALHQVRDRCLEGKLPLVFWDEFDSTLGDDELGWLRHFLVPMQDGTFQQGEITHPIGRAIFVFAGGIYESMEKFRSPDPGTATDDFKAAKGPDFVSRLKGYVNIVGPDPRKGDRKRDPYFRVRRAILLRSILERNRSPLVDGETDELQIDRGVLTGFLETRRYRHGVRSIEAIVAMSTLTGKTRYERSALPSEPQLELHVDARDFLRRVQGLPALEDRPEKHRDLPEPQQALFERLAEGVHLAYCEKVMDDGFVWAAPTDDYLSRHDLLKRFAGKMAARRRAGAERKSALVPYADLPPDLKEQNRQFARDIQNKLDRIGCMMRPARRGDPPFAFTDEEVEDLAEQEHERWMRKKLRAGWRWGPEDDDEVNSSLLPWRKLSPEEKRERYGDYAERVGDGELSTDVKDWDAFLVRSIPKVVAVAGYAIVRHPAEDA